MSKNSQFPSVLNTRRVAGHNAPCGDELTASRQHFAAVSGALPEAMPSLEECDHRRPKEILGKHLFVTRALVS
jgi:hypothetical protein